uniref:Uncharacterized protein n=1 Tax=Oryza nivara TaxID=4536 RepID=A0A0E0J3M6_ORYNI
MKFWAVHPITNNDHEEEDACGDPVDLLDGTAMVSRSFYDQAVPVDQINWHALNLKLWTYTEVKQIFEAIVFSHQQILMIQDRSERLKANLPKSGWKHLNT